MNDFGTMHAIRTEYVAGLFEIRICDKLKLAAVVGPMRTGAARDRMLPGEVENLRQHAISVARKKYGILGYELEHRDTVTNTIETIAA